MRVDAQPQVAADVSAAGEFRELWECVLGGRAAAEPGRWADRIVGSVIN